MTRDPFLAQPSALDDILARPPKAIPIDEVDVAAEQLRHLLDCAARGRHAIEQAEQQRRLFSDVRKRAGASTRHRVLQAWSDAEAHLRRQRGNHSRKGAIESLVAERLGISPRTVQRHMAAAAKARHKL